MNIYDQGLIPLVLCYSVFVVLLRAGLRASRVPRQFAFATATMLLTMAAAFRVVDPSMGGTDAWDYRRVFETIVPGHGVVVGSGGAASATEPLHIGLMLLARSLSDDYRLYFIFAYGLIAGCVVYFVAQTFTAQSPVWPLFLFFPAWLHSFNIMRNWIAIALFLVALTFFFRRRLFLYYLWLLIAIGFHFSAIVMLLLPLFSALLGSRRRLRGAVTLIVLTNGVAFLLASGLTAIFAGSKYQYYLQLEPSSWNTVIPLIVLTVTCFLVLGGRGPDHEGSVYGLLSFLAFTCGMISIIVFFGGYRYLSFAILPQAAAASAALRVLAASQASQLTQTTLARLTIFGSLLAISILMFSTVINLSGVFPFEWTMEKG